MKDGGPSGRGPKGYPAPSPGNHWLGIQTANNQPWGMYGALNVVNPQVNHSTTDYVAQRFLIKSCDATQWLEVGWAEVGWRSDRQYIYTYNSANQQWKFYDQYAVFPSNRVWFQIFNAGGGLWAADIWWNGGWWRLDTVNPGNAMGCAAELYAEINTGSGGKDFPFPNINFGDGTTGGVQIAPFGNWQTWDTRISTGENTDDGAGYYHSHFNQRYWDFYVDSHNAPPNVSVSVSPTSGDRSTTFSASVSASDSNGDALNSYRIDWGDGSTTWSSSGTHKYRTAGTYSVRANVCDTWGACTWSAPTTVSVAFSNTAPNVSLSVTPGSGDLTTSFQASTSAWDGEQDPMVFELDWGDGTVDETSSAAHRYSSPGNYTVTATAVDEWGAESSVSQAITVCTAGITGCSMPTTASAERSAYDVPLCRREWIDLGSGRCRHPDPAPAGPLDSEISLDAEYQSTLAGVRYAGGFSSATPAYCGEPENTRRYRVIYVRTESQTSRLASLKASLRDRMVHADFFVFKSARQLGARRHVRYECTRWNKVKIREVVLDDDARANHTATYEHLQGRTDYDRSKRYVAFADWQDSGNAQGCCTCGWGDRFSNETPGKDNPNNTEGGHIALVYLRPNNPCGMKLTVTVFHEIAHTLGAVLASAPNHDPAEPGHVSDGYDVLQQFESPVRCTQLFEQVRMDCGKDDYFNTSEFLPQEHYLADKQEYETGVCEDDPNTPPVDPETQQPVLDCHWNTAWSAWLVGGGSVP